MVTNEIVDVTTKGNEDQGEGEDFAQKLEKRTVVGHAHLCTFLQVDTDLIHLPRFPVHLPLRLRRPSRRLVYSPGPLLQCKQKQSNRRAA